MLTKNEQLVLKCIYALSLTTANEISKLTGLPKISVHYILKQLESHSLVLKRTKQNTFYYQATNPENIIKIYDKVLKEIQDQKDDAIKLVKELKGYKNYESKDKIYYYKDPKQISNIRKTLTESFFSKQIQWKHDEKNTIEIFEGKDFMFIISLQNNFGIRIEPKTDLDLLIKLISQYIEITK